MTNPMMILIAGPYRSGTGDDPALMAANLATLEQAAWPIFAAGHVPMIGEWVALPVLRSAGQPDPLGDLAAEVMYPTAARLLAHCDAVLRVSGIHRCRPGRRHRARTRTAGLFRRRGDSRRRFRAPGRDARVSAEAGLQPARTGPGLDEPDARGRTGLDRVGRDLIGNQDVIVRDVELLASGWHVLRRTTFDYRHDDGRWTRKQRETYDRGNGATILLYDLVRRTVLLTRQFRFPAYVNGHPDGMLIETAAGLLDADDPITAIRREAAEELGVHIGEPEHVFDVWMSPGSVTEQLHFYAAPYSPMDRTGVGGGVAEEGEDIEVLELGIAEAHAAISTGQIADAKTIMLLQWAALRGPFGRERVNPPRERLPT